MGTALLEIAQPRQPCFKLGMRMNDVGFPGHFEMTQRPGAYLRIIEPRQISAGGAIVVTQAEQPTVTIGALASEDLDEPLLREIVADDRIPERWRRSARRALGLPAKSPRS